MIIDNQKTIIKIKIRKLFLAILTGAIIVILLTTKIIGEEFFGLSNKGLSLLIGLLYVIYYLYQSFLEPNYIYFSDEGDKIVLRFYSTGLSGSKKSAFEIPKVYLHKFQIEKIIVNQKEKLILYQKTDKGIFKYPPVILSGLNDNEKRNLKNALKKCLNQG